MLDLALQDPEEYVSIKNIAGRQDISNKYLEQIITVSSRGGFVRSTRGSQGGCRLARKPEEYTVGMKLRLIEGNLVPVACMEDQPNQCLRSAQCATLEVWKELNDAINGVVDNITLADLVARQKAKMVLNI